MSQHDLLFELGTEELPPKALKTLSDALRDNFAANLQSNDFTFDSIENYAAPRRLALTIRNLADSQPDKNVERLGPAVAGAFNDDGSAKPAAVGFAKSCGVEVDQLDRIETDKGERLGYTIAQKGQPLSELIEDMLNSALKKLPIPKPMRWGDRSEQFIRPVHWAVLLFGDQVLNATVLGVKTSNQSRGHRFMSPDWVTFNSADDYLSKLLTAKVNADYEQRKEQIRGQVKAEADKLGGVAQIDESLLDEVASLVEWPVALTGKFDTEFLAVPAECLISSMAEHQKYFHVFDKDGKLMPNFITVSNIESNRPQSVIEGNEKVIRPRLADAMFFFETDKKVSLESHQDHLQKVVFQKQLGSILDKSIRVAHLAKYIAPKIGAIPEDAERAALLSKCDLATNMVGEFDNLQGIMGTYYARHDGENENVAIAMTEQYLPKFSGDELAKNSVGQCLAIADRVDSLVGIFGVGQGPKGSKDPFALRRAAIGLLRTIVENRLELDINELLSKANQLISERIDKANFYSHKQEALLDFLFERLRALYLDQGVSSNTISAVMALRPTQPLDFDARIKAVQFFQTLPEAESLSAANKRVKNILAKADIEVPDAIDSGLLQEAEEQALAKTITDAEAKLSAMNSYQDKLQHLASLRDDVDAFFDKVMVNADDAAVKANRLAMLKKLQDLFGSVADISLLQN
ncbi:glycine--tRNA ligase subunit beta [Kangiella koreensis]|uniref:Glycine--tRNA ligase beta subunit n=1 Tax=Kangiella koreensis (strain DSM 16069 / JCM 12317 / KCTC 12182 / SW-125) TaxID=523791 RepID=C7R9S8_KANKD|nr:glycine--tRNA ligase subunit beta [Kangiella koreensis]ACV27947.1 glycyl-tRNA synthetase, beta subunit [Kangiella koreensis DSM 16069]